SSCPRSRAGWCSAGTAPWSGTGSRCCSAMTGGTAGTGGGSCPPSPSEPPGAPTTSPPTSA
ncbi:unnamed protein product, partial [Coccothraustes coccothraustes]